MSNPFPWFKEPTSRREANSNANHVWYDLMGARDTLREYDDAGQQAPADVIAAPRVLATWHRELQRVAAKFPSHV